MALVNKQVLIFSDAVKEELQAADERRSSKGSSYLHIHVDDHAFEAEQPGESMYSSEIPL